MTIAFPLTCFPRHIGSGRQIGHEGCGHDAAWIWDCRCGWAVFASTWEEGRERFLVHVGDDSDAGNAQRETRP